MTTREALTELATKHSITLTVWKLRAIFDRGEVPKPRLDSSLSWDWTPDDIERVREAVTTRGTTVTAIGRAVSGPASHEVPTIPPSP